MVTILTYPEIKNLINVIYFSIIEGSFEVKLPTIWTDGKAEVGRVREEKRRSEKRKLRRKKIQAGEKVGKSRFTVFFQ